MGLCQGPCKPHSLWGDYPRKVKDETPVSTSFAGLAQNFQPDFVVYFSYPFKHSKDLEKDFYMTVIATKL